MENKSPVRTLTNDEYMERVLASGALALANATVFHPLGMALTLYIPDEGESGELSINVTTLKDNPSEGWAFAADNGVLEKMRACEKAIAATYKDRVDNFGFHIQGEPLTADFVADESIAEWFSWAHLTRPDMQAMSKAFHDVAAFVLATTVRGAERSTALRKLLEGKDAAVRAVMHTAKEEDKKPQRTV